MSVYRIRGWRCGEVHCKAFTAYESARGSYSAPTGASRATARCSTCSTSALAGASGSRILTFDVPKGLEGHGADAGLIRTFLDALVSGDPQAHLPDPRQALAAHHLTWAAGDGMRWRAVEARALAAFGVPADDRF